MGAPTFSRRKTAERGLGGGHQQARRKLLKLLRDGDPCARCAAEGRYHPLYRAIPPRLLEVDDFPPRVIALALGITPVKALSFRRCNRRAGARLSNQIQAVKRGQQPKSSVYTRW